MARFTLRLKAVSKDFVYECDNHTQEDSTRLAKCCKVPAQRYRSSRRKNQVTMTAIWDVALCSLVEDYRRFTDACCLHHHCPDDGGSKHL
jgi:hypothetical protein